MAHQKSSKNGRPNGSTLIYTLVYFLGLDISGGGCLEQALPDAEEWLRNNIIVAVGSMLINAPGKVLKGTVNTAHSIATKSIRGVGGLVNTTGVSVGQAFSCMDVDVQ